jgi:hypothetical protein
MIAMSRLVTELQYEIETGELTWRMIADKYEVPYEWVCEAAAMMTEAE